MKKKGKPALKINVDKLHEGELISEHAMDLNVPDDLFEVDRGVFVSGYTAAKQLKKLKDNKISSVFNIASYHCESPHEDEVEYHNYSLKDLPGEDMRHAFIEISRKVYELNKDGRNVLIHCYKVI